MNTPSIDPTRSTASPSDSILMTLARAAMATGADAAEVTWPSLDLNDPRQREFGDYELLEEIGRGGMGVVYRARQRSLDRDVAIKFIAAALADSFNVARFFGEARAAARLMHPNIVPVHEVGSIDGVHYFSMPLIKGRTLAQLLDAAPMRPDQAVALLLKLCDAIDYAHRLGLLHLDLKPANVMLDERGEPLVADFGLARHMDANGGVDTQEVSGTPSFMAPEQILIKQFRLTPATDIYALGAVLYRALSGVSPHGEGKADELTQRAIAGRVRPLRELLPKLSRDLAAVTMKCLELLPKDRYTSVAALADDLRRIREQQPVTARRPGLLERLRRWGEKPEAAVLALLIATLLAVGKGTYKAQQAEAQARMARAEAIDERDRAKIAGEIGAHLYSYAGKDDKRAEDLLIWLRNRLPGDEERQADALTAFVASVDAGNRGSLDDLLFGISQVLGGDYRQEMIRSLQASTDSKSHLYAALLAWQDDHELSEPKTFASSLEAAIDAHPEDPLTWQIAAVYCPGPEGHARCLHPNAAENLTRLDPENMYSWLLLTITASDREPALAALHEAAKRTKLDDYFGATVAAYAKAVETADVEAPALIARPAQLLAPNEAPGPSIALTEAYSTPFGNWQMLIGYCGVRPGVATVTDPQLLADCRAIGERMVQSEGSILTQMIGVALVRHLAKGSPAAEVAIRKRQLYQYLLTTDAQLTSSQRAIYSSARYLQDMTTIGEMGAWQRRNKALGLPDQPPTGWQPDDPYSSLSVRERIDDLIALNLAAEALVAQGNYADAIASLVAIEAPTRKYLNGANAWRLPRHLLVLGKARLALGDYAAAKAHLSEAWEIVQSYPPGTQDSRDCAKAIADLYSAWSAVEPGNGFDAKAVEWQQKLASLEAANDH